MFTKIEEKLQPLTMKIDNQRHLVAVRDALISTIPITMISSIALLLVYLPWPQSYVDFMASNERLTSFLLDLNTTGMGLLSIYVAYAIGSNLAKSYKIPGVTGGITALFTFMVTMQTTDDSIALQYLGGEGLFTAIIVSIFAIEITKFFIKHKITIKLPDTVPPNILGSFESLMPMIVSVLVVHFITNWLGFDINQVINTAVAPLLSASSNSIWLPIVYVLLTGLMWFFGLHPNVLAAVVTPIWLINSEANMEALRLGQSIPNIGVKPFIFTFLFIGGGGGTLPLVIHMIRSKSEQLKTLGKLGLGPGLFNINEPILFGAPIVLNPTLIIPFVGGMLVNTVITYLAFTTGLVPGMGNPLAAEWTVPSIIAGPLITNSWRAGILVLINFIVSYIIYYPFFKVFEKEKLEEEGEL